MYVDMKKQCHEIMFYDATCFYVENNRNCSGVFETSTKNTIGLKSIWACNTNYHYIFFDDINPQQI